MSTTAEISLRASNARTQDTADEVRRAYSRDADVQATLLHGWNQEYAQISAGEFSGDLLERRLDGVCLFVESTSQGLLQSGALSRDTVAVGIPLKMPGTAVFCGEPAQEAAVHVFSGATGFEFYSPPGLVMSGIVTSRTALFALLSEQERAVLTPRLERAHLAGASDGAVAAMRDLIHTVLNLTDTCPQLVSGSTLRQTLRESVLSNLAQLLMGGYPMSEPRLRAQRRWRLVTQAREFVLARAGIPTNITDICQAVGASRRTLQYCFQETLGISPLEFLRAVRLDGVRRMLRSAPTVTDAAAHWGFWHLGYFSQDYRNMFGELPSQTYRRYRHAASPQREIAKSG